LIFAISAVSESSDHYLWCVQGTPDEIVEKIQNEMGDEFAYLYIENIQPLVSDTLNYQYARELKDKLSEAIDTAMDDL